LIDKKKKNFSKTKKMMMKILFVCALLCMINSSFGIFIRPGMLQNEQTRTQIVCRDPQLATVDNTLKCFDDAYVQIVVAHYGFKASQSCPQQPGQLVVTDLVNCEPLLDWACREEVPGNSPSKKRRSINQANPLIIKRKITIEPKFQTARQTNPARALTAARA
jgi:hypothetical protein